MSWIAGVDGCKAGWVVALADMSAAREPPILRVILRLTELLRGGAAPVLVAVDMPIGLPDRIERLRARAEQSVRACSASAQSSVFSIPARRPSRLRLSGGLRLALATSEPPRKVSKQGFLLFPKIRRSTACCGNEPVGASGSTKFIPNWPFGRCAARRF